MAESAAYARRGMKGGAKATTIPSAITDATTTITCADLTSWAGATTNGPATATIDLGLSSEETIEFTGISGSDLTGVTRGVGGTSASAHGAGATIVHSSQVRDFNEANAHIASTALDHHTQYLMTDGSRVLTGRLKIIAGTVGSPGLQFDSDSDTGLTRVSANVLAIVTGGAERVRVDGTGQVFAIGQGHLFGVGALGAAGTYVEIDGTPTETYVQAKGTTTNIPLILRTKGSSSFLFQTGLGAEVARIESDGEILAVGLVHLLGQGALGAAGSALQLSGTAADVKISAVGTPTNIPFYIKPKGTGELQLQDSSDTPRIRINSTGLAFFNSAPVAKPTGVAVTAAGIHAALVTLGLIAA